MSFMFITSAFSILHLTAMCIVEFFIGFIFQSTFSFTAKPSGRYRDSSYTLCPPQAWQSPGRHRPPEWYTITTDKSTLIYHHSKPRVYISFALGVVHSLDFNKYIMDPSLEYHKEEFHCPKNALDLAY